jgi:hypothetical protein
VSRETTTKPPTPAPRSATRRNAARARQYTPQTTDCSPNSRRYGSLARNSGGNGYQTFAKTPTSGRPMATEPK